MTIRLYADFKKLPLDNVSVQLSHEGALDDEQRKRLMEIADRCPVHKTLQSKIEINTTERRA